MQKKKKIHQEREGVLTSEILSLELLKYCIQNDLQSFKMVLRPRLCSKKISKKKKLKPKIDLYRLVHVGKRGFCDSALSKQVNTPCFCMV